jgi:hypothetical protein
MHIQAHTHTHTYTHTHTHVRTGTPRYLLKIRAEVEIMQQLGKLAFK